MDLTEKTKKIIDSMSYENLLRGWRLEPLGDPMFEGESGLYWGDRMTELKDSGTVNHVAISKKIGWKIA